MKLSPEQKQFLQGAAAHYNQDLMEAETYLLERGLNLQVGNTHLLGVVKHPLTGHEQYEGRLAIPYITRTGVVDIRFRSLDGSEPKYLGLPGATTKLYNVTAIMTDQQNIHICEGELDAISLSSIGLPAVGVPGANNWKKHFTRLLADFAHIYVWADGDQPGLDFARMVAKELGFVTIIQMPQGEDVNSMLCKAGRNYFYQKMGLESEGDQ